MNDKRNLIYAAAGMDESGRERTLYAKLLAAALLRTAPEGPVQLMRGAQAEKPLFRVARQNLDEVILLPREQEAPQPWRCRDDVDSEKCDWVLFLGPGTLALRNVDHLLSGTADILWAPLTDLNIRDLRTCGYLTEAEMTGGRTSAPVSRPWHRGASGAVWAVRGHCFAEVMTEWERIADDEPLRATLDRAQSAWNRLLMDTPLKVARLEKGEVHFPCLPGADYPKWKDAALIHVGEWPAATQDAFLQAFFYGTFFGDSSGMFLNILEP
jgi:hypothetical protein